MGKISKGVGCSVSGCSNNAYRSLAGSKARQGGLNVGSDLRRAYLCSEHYKEWKKEIKQSKSDDISLRYRGGF
ncbi:MAG: hypothetical protein ACE5JV_02285 [Nitrososphaerales archaeon]